MEGLKKEGGDIGFKCHTKFFISPLFPLLTNFNTYYYFFCAILFISTGRRGNYGAKQHRVQEMFENGW